jgi:signal transduction histidine kinase
MTNDLLDVSRLEERRMPIEAAMCDLAQIASEVCAALLPLDPERPIQVDCLGAVPVHCDVALIRRVLENLVANAIRHTPPRSRVRIGIDRADGRVRVAVHDEGPGVPAEARQKIFEKFGTIELRHERAYQSIGLGLAFCKLAIEAQGGTIGVDSGVPIGSTFWFELPDQRLA